MTGAPVSPLGRIAVLGAGAEAMRMARQLQGAGGDVIVVEPDGFAAERAQHHLRRLEGANAALNIGTDPAALARADLILDTMEDAGDRATCLPYLVVASAVIVTTCLHELPGLAQAIIHPARLCGLAVAGPGHLRGLIEIIPTSASDPRTHEAAQRLATTLGKTALVRTPMGEPLAARLLTRLVETADHMLLHGAIPHELDEAMVAFGYDIGVYEAQDLIGMEVGYAQRRRTGRPSLIADRMVEEGRLGHSAGVGWYRYPGGGGAVIDPLVEDLIREEARFAGITSRAFAAAEMQDTLFLALVHEALGMLGAPNAPSPADLDIAAILGLGFPADEGGPLARAAARGKPEILRALAARTDSDPALWAPITAWPDQA